uniref:glycosyltransferase n=1 Tax=Actinoplanes philippinensis TaxID=35752 RepID=UPI0033E87ADF
MNGGIDQHRDRLRVGMVVCSEYESDARVRRQAEALAARGDEVTVFALGGRGRPDEEVIDGVHVVHAPTSKYRGDSVRAYLSLYGGFTAHAAGWLARRPRSFDLVQAHSVPEAIIFAAAVQGILRVPLLLDVHDLSPQLFASKFAGHPLLPKLLNGSVRASFGFATEVLTVHEPYAETIREMTSRPVSVVMNAPDDRYFQPRPFRPWDPAGEVVFGYHGLIAPRHGLSNVAEALSRLRAEVPGARLLVMGNGDGLTPLREDVTRLGLTDVVELPERSLPVPEVVGRLEGVHIGLVPSKLDPWTNAVLPTKLLEYATLGIPAISFRNPVIDSVFTAEEVMFADPATPDTLYEAMLAVVRDVEGARRRAAAASTVVEGIAWQRQKEVYLDLVDRMTSRRKPHVPRQRGALAADRE